jgi:integrase
MAGKVRNMVDRSGRYYARLVVPKDLRGVVGKTELRLPLGGDYQQALKRLPSAVSQLQVQIALAERRAAEARGTPQAPGRYPLSDAQIALLSYHARLEQDLLARHTLSAYANNGIDDSYVTQLRMGIAGAASDAELNELVGHRIEHFRKIGNTTAQFGSQEWRSLAMSLCVSEYEALERVVELDEGNYAGEIAVPLLVNAQPPVDALEPVKLTGLWADYVAGRVQAGFMRDGGKRHRPVIESLRAFLKHDDAARIRKKDLLLWRDNLVKTLSAKTVNDVYLSAIRTLFAWAVENERLPEDVAKDVKQPKPKKVYSRERGYTDKEALTVLKASRAYQPHADESGYVRETPQLVAAKRWVPIICAFTGARVAEITQLRGADVRQEGADWIIRISPDAGTVKSGGYRDVPLHRQIIACGFGDFVKAAGQGPLFHKGKEPASYEAKAKRIANQLAEWLRKEGITPDGVQPNHGWRHRLKTQCRELGISDRVFDAIQGHAGRTASDNYGDVTLKTKIDAIARLPEYVETAVRN